jgi:hypothetical protein
MFKYYVILLLLRVLSRIPVRRQPYHLKYEQDHSFLPIIQYSLPKGGKTRVSPDLICHPVVSTPERLIKASTSTGVRVRIHDTYPSIAKNSGTIGMRYVNMRCNGECQNHKSVVIKGERMTIVVFNRAGKLRCVISNML